MQQLLKNISLTFTPSDFVIVMGLGISSNILYNFTYESFWLRRASYPVFALASLCMCYFHLLFTLNLFYFIRENSFRDYFKKYFKNPMISLFWGTYSMGWITLINYMVNLVAHDSNISIPIKKRLLQTCYVLWWYSVGVELFTAYVINFFIFKEYFSNEKNGFPTLSVKEMSTSLQTPLLLPFAPLVVSCSCSASFTMLPLFTDIFGKRIQSLTLVFTGLLWCQGTLIILMLITIFFWNLYVNKLPPLPFASSLFVVLGPLGQAAFGVLMLSNDTILYSETYFPIPNTFTIQDDIKRYILILTIPWMFKIIGLILSLFLLGFGYFYTIFSIFSLCHYSNMKMLVPNSGEKYLRIYHFNKTWWGTVFAMGTMSLGSNQLYIQFNEFIPLNAFHVIGAIYGAACIIWSIICCLCTIWFSIVGFLRDNFRETLNEIGVEP